MNINRFGGSDHVEPLKLLSLNNLIHLTARVKLALVVGSITKLHLSIR